MYSWIMSWFYSEEETVVTKEQIVIELDKVMCEIITLLLSANQFTVTESFNRLIEQKQERVEKLKLQFEEIVAGESK